MAVISFDLPSTARWPSASPCSLAQALADQVQRPVIVAAATRPADGLAVDRHHLALDPDRQ